MKQCLLLSGMTFLILSGFATTEPLSHRDTIPLCENLLNEKNEHALRAKQMNLKPLNKIRSPCCCKKGQRGTIRPLGPKGNRGERGKRGATGPTGTTGAIAAAVATG